MYMETFIFIGEYLRKQASQIYLIFLELYNRIKRLH
jgi:hypothetical protein